MASVKLVECQKIVGLVSLWCEAPVVKAFANQSKSMFVSVFVESCGAQHTLQHHKLDWFTMAGSSRDGPLRNS